MPLPFDLTDEEKAKLIEHVETNPIDQMSAEREQRFDLLKKDSSEMTPEELAQYESMDPMMRGLLENGPMVGAGRVVKTGAEAFPKLAKMFQTGGGIGSQKMVAESAAEALKRTAPSKFGKVVVDQGPVGQKFGKVKIKP